MRSSGDKLPSERDEEQGVHVELLARLRQHGVELAELTATDGEIADLLSAVEGFEAAVQEAGGDLFVDSPGTSAPDDPRFVLPRMGDDETVVQYAARIQAAADQLGA